MLQYKISASTEKELRDFVVNNYNAFSPDFSEMSERTNYCQKLFEKATHFEMWDEGKLIGLLCSYFDEKIGRAYIPYVCIAAQCKGKGIGTVLYQHFTKNIKDRIHYVDLEVRITNISAYNFYAKLGFVEISRNAEKIQLRHVLK